MRHGNGYGKLGMRTSHRIAVLRNMATSLVLNERISTTLARAKEIRPIVEKLVTLGKRGDLHARRQVAAYVFDKAATAKLFSDLSSRHKTRPGGYTRIMRTGFRRGDGAETALIEFVDFEFKMPTEKVKDKAKDK